MSDKNKETDTKNSNTKNNKKKKRRGLRAKMIIMVLIMFVVMAVSMQVVVGWVYITWTQEKYARNAFSIASIAADNVDGDSVERYRDTLEKDDEYERTKEFLMRIRENADLKYMYVCIPEEDGYMYIWDAGDPNSEEGVMDLGDFDVYYGDGAIVMPRIFAKAVEEDQDDSDREFLSDSVLITDHEVYGFVASAFVPILNSAGEPVALASVDIAMENIITEVIKLGIITGFLMVAVMLGFCIIFYWTLARKVVRPIRNLNDIVTHFVSKQMKEGAVLECDVHTGDEIEALADSFSAMSLELKEYMENFQQVTKEKEKIGAELSVAQKIQEDMLPRIFPPYPDRQDFEIYASMDPAKEVGGDFYDLFLVDDDHLALVIADVSGKGVPAALFMVITKTLLKNRAMLGGDPAQIVYDVNNQLCEGNEAEYFATVWFAVIDLKTGDGISVNAGHEHPVLKRKDGDFELVKYRHAPPIGTVDGIPFLQREFHLDRGDVLFVYTDGVAEATNASSELYGTDRLLEVLNKYKDADPKELLHAVTIDTELFVGDAPQFDDLTMLAFRLNEEE